MKIQIAEMRRRIIKKMNECIPKISVGYQVFKLIVKPLRLCQEFINQEFINSVIIQKNPSIQSFQIHEVL